jgi:chromosome partitioning protein
MKVLALFNNKGGVGKTTLTYHLSHMFARQGLRTLVVDLDPQSNLTAAMVSDGVLEMLWNAPAEEGRTVAACVDLLRRDKGDLRPPAPHPVADNLWLVPGDLVLSAFEQRLAEAWSKASAADESSLARVCAFADLVALGAQAIAADVVLLDVGPSLGALNRAALMACDQIAIPVAPDLFSLRGLRNVGPTLRDWRQEWHEVVVPMTARRTGRVLPNHEQSVCGYLVQQHMERSNLVVTGYRKWAEQIPRVFRSAVLNEEPAPDLSLQFAEDPWCIGLLRHHASLIPLAQLARKPIFDLKQADGVGGGQLVAVARAREEFGALAKQLLGRMKLAPTANGSRP